MEESRVTHGPSSSLDEEEMLVEQKEQVELEELEEEEVLTQS